jgi:hypothetical protein
MMCGDLKIPRVIAGLIFIAVALMLTDSASAISVEVAKKCDALTAKAFPPRQAGNPAAGSASGTGADQRAYFKDCVEKESKAQSAK